MIRAIKEIYDFKMGSYPELIGYTLMDEETGQIKDVGVEELIKVLKKTNIQIRNLELDLNRSPP